MFKGVVHRVCFGVGRIKVVAHGFNRRDEKARSLLGDGLEMQ